MKALVTGATGVVGANLVRELLRQGWSVRALVRRNSVARALAGLPVEIMRGDVLDLTSVRAGALGVDVIFHAAARFAYWGVLPAELERVAVLGTQNVILAAATEHVRRVVVTSSSVIFGSSTAPDVRTERSPFTDADESPYALSKLHQARAALRLAGGRGVDLVLVCPTLTLGGFDFYLSTSNAIVVKYLNDPFRTTFAGGCNIVAASDVARGHVLVAERGEANQAYILGAQNVTWRRLHEMLSDLCAAPGPLSTAGHTIAYLSAAWCEALAKATGAPPNITRAEAKMVGRFYWYDDASARSLGYVSVSTRDALTATLRWLIKTEHLNPVVRAGARILVGGAQEMT